MPTRTPRNGEPSPLRGAQRGGGSGGEKVGGGEHELDSATFHIDDLNLGSLDIDCGWFFLGYV